MFQVSNIQKTYDQTKVILNDITLRGNAGEIIAITGASGSGKTTLLQILSTLDRPTSGEVWCNATQLTDISDEERSRFRAEHFGFIFQSHHLLADFTALENILLPAKLNSLPFTKRDAEQLLHRTGMYDKRDELVTQLSGGERQRIAVARALVTNPKVIFADEPTGNLDPASGSEVFNVLRDAAKNALVFIVTHNHELASHADKHFILNNGELCQNS